MSHFNEFGGLSDDVKANIVMSSQHSARGRLATVNHKMANLVHNNEPCDCLYSLVLDGASGIGEERIIQVQRKNVGQGKSARVEWKSMDPVINLNDKHLCPPECLSFPRKRASQEAGMTLGTNKSFALTFAPVIQLIQDVAQKMRLVIMLRMTGMAEDGHVLTIYRATPPLINGPYRYTPLQTLEPTILPITAHNDPVDFVHRAYPLRVIDPNDPVEYWTVTIKQQNMPIVTVVLGKTRNDIYVHAVRYRRANSPEPEDRMQWALDLFDSLFSKSPRTPIRWKNTDSDDPERSGWLQLNQNPKVYD